MQIPVLLVAALLSADWSLTVSFSRMDGKMIEPRHFATNMHTYNPSSGGYPSEAECKAAAAELVAAARKDRIRVKWECNFEPAR